MLSTQLNLTCATIYLAPDAAPPERYAAEELRTHLARITGQDFPLHALPAPDGAPAILLGRTAAATLLPGFDWATLQEDGVLLKTVGQALVLAGATPRGTLYAVYEFLDQVLGCRWLTPTCSVMPPRETLEIGAIDHVYVPKLRYRDPFFSAVVHSGDWLARNRANSSMGGLEERHGGPWVYAGFAHTFYPLVPPEKYFDQHPEYYSEIDGKRVYVAAQLCLTNEELLDVICENIRAELRRRPDARIISVTQNDWGGWCQCAQCRAIDEAEGSPSGTMIRFVNAIAERLEAEYPQIYFDTFAYTYTVRPPKTIRPRKNVIVRLCHITPCCDAHPIEECEQNRWFYEVLQGWGAIAPELFIWDYYNNFLHYFQPFPNLDAIAKDIRLFADHGVTGIFVQGDGTPPKGCGDMAELRAWVMGRLLWNPALDAWALVDEFLGHYYGVASPYLRDYLEQLHLPARGGDNHFHLYQELESPAVAGEAIERYHALFDQAEKAVEHDPVLRDRVQAARLPVEYITWQRALQFTMQGDRYALADPAMAQRMRTFFDVAERHGVGGLRERGASLADLRTLAEGYALTWLDNGRLRLGIAPAMGGRLMTLHDTATGLEWLHLGEQGQLDYPFTGGYEEYSEHIWRSPGCNEVYDIAEQDAQHLRISAVLENGLTLQRAYRLGEGEQSASLFITTTISNNSTTPRSGCFRSMPEFFTGPMSAATVRFQEQGGGWCDALPWQETTADNGSALLDGEAMPWGACRLCRDGHALTMHFDAAMMKKMLYDWDRTFQFVRFGLYGEGVMLQPGESYTMAQEWRCA